MLLKFPDSGQTRPELIEFRKIYDRLQHISAQICQKWRDPGSRSCWATSRQLLGKGTFSGRAASIFSAKLGQLGYLCYDRPLHCLLLRGSLYRIVGIFRGRPAGASDEPEIRSEMGAQGSVLDDVSLCRRRCWPRNRFPKSRPGSADRVGTSNIEFAAKIDAGKTKYRPNAGPERPLPGEVPILDILSRSLRATHTHTTTPTKPPPW